MKWITTNGRTAHLVKVDGGELVCGIRYAPSRAREAPAKVKPCRHCAQWAACFWPEAKDYERREIRPRQAERDHASLLKLYGEEAGRQCKDCRWLMRFRMGSAWFKCAQTLPTGGTGTDWRSGWQACGMFEEEDV